MLREMRCWRGCPCALPSWTACMTTSALTLCSSLKRLTRLEVAAAGVRAPRAPERGASRGGAAKERAAPCVMSAVGQK